MVQYRVCRIAGAGPVLDLQTDLIDTGTRVVAPLLPLSGGPVPLGRLELTREIIDPGTEVPGSPPIRRLGLIATTLERCRHHLSISAAWLVKAKSLFPRLFL